MPYKFEHEYLKIKDKNDRRIKLLDEDNDLKTIKDISNFKKHIKYWLE